MNNNLGTPFAGSFIPTAHTSFTALTSGVATVTSVGNVTYCIHGKVYTKTAGALTIGTTDANGVAFAPVLANTAVCVVLCYDTSAAGAGTVKALQGPSVPLDAGGNYIVARPEFPVVSDNFCPFAYIIVKNGSTGSAWTLGTSLWNATGLVNVGPISVMMLPGRPQAA